MKAWFTTYSSTNAMESLTKVFTVLVLIATTLPICLLSSAILPVLLLLGQLAVRYVSLGWKLKFSILSTENDELLVSFSFLSELACFVLPIFASLIVFSSFCFICCVTIQAFYYPPKAGYPIGTADSPSSYLLELHYDNPDGVEGQNCCT